MSNHDKKDFAPRLRELRRLDDLGLQQAHSRAIEQLASFDRQFHRNTFATEVMESKVKMAYLYWRVVPQLIESVRAERKFSNREAELHKLLLAQERAVRLMFEADQGEDGEAFGTAYQKVRETHQRVQDHLNEGNNNGHIQEASSNQDGA